jgi:23S rRNA (guanine745-N1)-methyltransferase
MTLASLAQWLRCPTCLAPLDALDSLVLGCENAHRFDVNKRGYISLLSSSSPKMIGDNPAMLDAREAFLGAGWYDPILATLVSLATGRGNGRIVDLGCGTGHYLAGLLSSTAGTTALASDLSPAAVARTVRHTNADGLVADVWQPLPIRDAAATIVLNVFAPRNPSEFKRILAPHGVVLCVVPTARHLHQLQSSGRALTVPAGKAAQVASDMEESFVVDEVRSVEFDMDLSGAEVDAVLAMGPSAHHQAGAVIQPLRGPITASVDVLRLRRR